MGWRRKNRGRAASRQLCRGPAALVWLSLSTRPGFKKKKKKSELTSPHLRCFSPFSVPVSCFSSVKCFALCVVSPVSLCSHSPRQLFPTFFPPQTPLSSPRTHVASFFSDDHGQPPLPTTPAVSGVAALRFPSHLLCQMDGQSLLWSFLPEPRPSRGTGHPIPSHLLRKHFSIFLHLPLSRLFPISIQRVLQFSAVQ